MSAQVFSIAKLQAARKSQKRVKKVNIQNLVALTLLEANTIMDSDYKMAARNRVRRKKGEPETMGRANTPNFNRTKFLEARANMALHNTNKVEQATKMVNKGLHICQVNAHNCRVGAYIDWQKVDNFWEGIALLEQAGRFDLTEYAMEKLYAN